MNIDPVPQAPITNQTINPIWRQWLSNLQLMLVPVPDSLLGFKEVENIDSVKLEKIKRSFIHDKSTGKFYLVLNGQKREMKFV